MQKPCVYIYIRYMYINAVLIVCLDRISRNSWQQRLDFNSAENLFRNPVPLGPEDQALQVSKEIETGGSGH